MAYTIIRVDWINANRIFTSSNFSSGNRQTREGLNMTLYDLIYQFFELYVFRDEYNASLGHIYFYLGVEDSSEGLYPIALSFQEWLCHTASLISITIIVVLCCLFVYKIVKLIGGLIR